MKKLSLLLAFAAFALPAVAQQEGAGEYAATQVAAGPPLGVPPGIYADTAARLNGFFAATAGERTIYAAALKAQIDRGVRLMMVDVRPAAAYASGHVAGAISIPLTVLFRPENLGQLPADGTPIVLICSTGHTASMALGGLVALGYNPYVLRFSMMGWRAQTQMKFYSVDQVPQTVYGLGGPMEP